MLWELMNQACVPYQGASDTELLGVSDNAEKTTEQKTTQISTDCFERNSNLKSSKNPHGRRMTRVSLKQHSSKGLSARSGEALLSLLFVPPHAELHEVYVFNLVTNIAHSVCYHHCTLLPCYHYCYTYAFSIILLTHPNHNPASK